MVGGSSCCLWLVVVGLDHRLQRSVLRAQNVPSTAGSATFAQELDWRMGHRGRRDIRRVRGEGANMLRRYAARLLSSSVEFKRQTEGVVDGPEFIETHAANKFAEPFRSYRRRLFDEYLCFFAVERDGRTKGTARRRS